MRYQRNFNGTKVTVGDIRFTSLGGGEGLIAVHPSQYRSGDPESTQFYVSGWCKNMSQEDFALYKRAKLLSDPINGGDVDTAINFLRAHGFEALIDQ